MNKEVSNFLHTVTEEIKYSKVHKIISQELESHIEDLKDDFIKEGMEENKAYTKALECMGNPINIGQDLNKTHRPRIEWSIFTLIGILVAIGLYGILTYSTYFSDNLIYKQLVWVAIGSCILFIAFFINYKKVEKYSLIGYMSTTIIMIILMMMSPTINGARSYMSFFGIAFRISSIGMPFLIIFFVGIVKKYCTGSIKGIFMVTAIAIPSLCTLLMLYDAPRAIITVISYGVIILSTVLSNEYNGNKKKGIFTLVSIGTVALVSVFLSILIRPYAMRRLTIIFDPYSDPNGSRYLIVKLKELWSNANFIGNSDALISNQNGQVSPIVPNLESDFMFTFISTSLGWVMGVMLIVILAAVIIRLFLATQKLNDFYGKVICIAVCTVFFMQIIVNVFMNLGYLPITGCGLPFISYGGSDFVGNSLFIGIFLGIYRRKDILICE